MISPKYQFNPSKLTNALIVCFLVNLAFAGIFDFAKIFTGHTTESVAFATFSWITFWIAVCVDYSFEDITNS